LITAFTKVPRFKELKFYYDCNLNREEYWESGYITELEHNTPRTRLIQPLIIIHTDGMHHQSGNNVGRRQSGLIDDKIPRFVNPFKIIIRPDVEFNWNREPSNAHDN
jgi:hypothetical protein